MLTFGVLILKIKGNYVGLQLKRGKVAGLENTT